MTPLPPTTTTRIVRPLGIAYGLWGLIALATTSLAIDLLCLRGPDSLTLLDDAYFQVRFADHLWAGQGWVWNPDDGPLYGLTGPLFMALLLPCRLLSPDNATFAAHLASGMGMVLLLGGLAALVHRWKPMAPEGPSARPSPRMWQWAFVLLALAPGGDLLSLNAQSGMETGFAAAWLAGGLLLGQPPGMRGAGWIQMVALALWSGLAFAVRPELGLYAFAWPLGLYVAEPDAGARARRLWALIGGCLVWVAWFVFTVTQWGSAVPLAFFVKQPGHYDAAFELVRAGEGPRRLGAFLLDFLPLVGGMAVAAWAMGCHVVMGFRQGVDAGLHACRAQAPDLALLGATLIWWIFHGFWAVPVMAQYERFLLPTLPALVWLGMRGFTMAWDVGSVGMSTPVGPSTIGTDGASTTDAVLGKAPGGSKAVSPPGHEASTWPRVRRWGLIAWILVILTLWIPHAASQARATLGRAKARLHDGLFHPVRGEWARCADPEWRMWPALCDISRLPDDLVIATTDIGAPGVLNPHKRIIDMAGLQDRNFARRGLDLDRLLLRDRPDVIYFPFPDYGPLIDRLQAHPALARDYEVIRVKPRAIDPRQPVRLPVAIRRDSRHFEDVRRAVWAMKAAEEGGDASPDR